MAGERLTALLNEREQQREAQRKAQMAAKLQAEEQRQAATARQHLTEQQQQRAASYNRVQQAITAKQQGDERTMEQIRRDPEFLKRREERTVGMGALGRWATNTARGTSWEEPVRTTFGTAGNIMNGLLGGGATLRAAGNQLQADLFRDQEAYQRAEWLRNEAGHLQNDVASNFEPGTWGRRWTDSGYSAGATLPGLAWSVATANPVPMAALGASQAGADAYTEARVAGAAPGTAATHALVSGVAEGAGEYVGGKLLLPVMRFGGNGTIGQVVKRGVSAAVGEPLEEVATQTMQDASRTALLETSPDKWQQYRQSWLNNSKEAAIGGLLGGALQGGIGRGLSRAVHGNVQPPAPPVRPQPAPQAPVATAQQPARAGRIAKGSGNAVVDTTHRIQQATANGGYQTRQSPAADLQSLTGNAAVERSVQLMIHHESRGKVNAQNPLSSAGGLGGFIDSTWLTMVKRYRPDIAAGKSNAQIIALKTRDGALATEMTRHYIQENARHLEKNGLPSTMANLRLAHWFGAGGAVQLLNVANKNQPIANVVSPAVMKANPNIQGKTVQQVIDITHREMYGKAAQNMGRMAKGGNSAGMPDSPDTSPTLPDRQAAFSNGMEDNSQAMQEMQRAARESQAAAEEMREQSERLGRQTKVYLDNQMRQARLQLMEADELAPSVAGTDNQYRDRSRAASQMQVNHIAQNLEPELLGDSKEVGTGAPTLANDGRTIIGGNGRVMGLAQAYANGNGEGYRQYLLDNAEQFGLSRDEIARMNKPVLVRQLDESVDIAKAAVASNEGGGLGMSALEQARADADRLPDFGHFIADDSGELNTAANRGFIRDFVGAMPHTVRAQMVDADGRLSQDGVRRLRNALLYRAYGNSPTLSRMVESTDQGARNLVNALVQAAPKIAQARDNIRAGAMHDADIAEEVVQAAEKLNQIREQGGSVADYLAQQGLFGEEMNAVSRELLAFFEEHKRSGKAIATLLRNYYDALAAQGNPNQQDVFGEQAAPDKQHLLERTINDYEQEHGRSSDSGQLFERADERPAGEPVSETEPQPASRRSDEAGAGENQSGTERDGEQNGRVAGEDAPKLSRSASTQEKYEQRIDELFAGRHFRDQVRVLDRSDLLDMLGYGSKPVVLVNSKVNAAKHPNMDAAAWKRVPEWLDNPAMVFESQTESDRLVFIAPETAAGNMVRIIIEPKADQLEAHVLVNAYDMEAGNTIMPRAGGKYNPLTTFAKWRDDGLLKYIDKEKTRLLASRSGLLLPRRLLQPTGLGKILTEKNLQGYLKSNPALSLNHSGNTPSTATPERVAEIRQQVARAVGQRNMRLIDVLTAAEASRPDGAQDLRGVDGWYDPKSKRITLIADNLPNARAAQFAAWHELGHHKIDVAGWQQWQAVLEQARLNPTIRQLAQTINRQRQAAGEAINIDTATEEAAVELYSAMKNSDYAALEDKYKVNVPLAMRGGLAGYFARFAQRLQAVLAKAFGIRQAEFGDGEVFELLRKIDRAEEAGSQPAETAPPQDATPENSRSDEATESAKLTEKFSRSESTLEEKPGWLDRNELGEWEKGLAAYHSLGRLVKPVLAKLKLANTAPQEFTEMMRDYRSQLNVAGMTASEMAQAGVQMTAEERALLSDILEKELPPGIEVSPEMQELAGTIRELLSRQGEQLADLGMLSRESLERFKDTYLPRLYRQRTELFGGNDLAKLNREFNKAMRGGLGNALGGQHLKGRGIFKTVSRSEQADYEAKGYELRQDFGNQGKHAGKVLVWRDYTREERAQMGEERDAILRFTQGYVQTQADLAKGVLFQRIAQNEELASKTEVEGWEKVPDTTIAGTGGVHRYGALAGMYVHPDVYYHLKQQFAVQNVALKIWRASLGWWKLTKTVYNPVAHTNNVVSNFSLLFIAGGRVRDLQPAAASIRNKDALYREALELGLVGEAVDSAGIRELFTGLNNTDDDAVITDSFFRRVLKRADRLALGIPGKISDKAQTFYRVEDEVFKMALYRMARSKGLSNTEARDYTLNFFFDYGEVPQGIKFVRDTGLLPFVSYTYKAIPAVLRGALTRPHRYLAVTTFFYAINALSYAMMAGDDEEKWKVFLLSMLRQYDKENEERKYMPEYLKGMTSFGVPKQIRMPGFDGKGKPMFTDVYRWMPLGDFADVGNRTGGMPIPQFMNPNGPLVSTYNAMFNNVDTFTGGKLTQDYMTTQEKTVIRAKWLAGQILPASVGMPFSYHTNNVMDGLKNTFEGTKFSEVLEDLGWTGKTYRGEDKQLYRALLGSFGFKIRGERPEDWKAADRRRRNHEAQEIRAANRRTMRDNSLSQSAKDARLRSNAEHMQNLFKED